MAQVLVAALVLLATSGELAVEHNSVRAVVQLDHMTFGLADATILTLTLTGDAPLIVHPQPGLGLSPVWQATPLGPPVQSTHGRQARWQRRYRLTAFRPGSELALTLAPVALQAGPPPTEPFTLSFPTLHVTVTSQREPAVPGDPAELPDLEPEIPRHDTTRAIGPWLGLSLVLGTIIALAWWCRPPRQRPSEPADWATTALRRADSATAIAAVLGGYLVRKHGLMTQSQTTSELNDQLTALSWNADHRSELMRLITECDRGRFGTAFVNVSALRHEACAWIRRDAAGVDGEPKQGKLLSHGDGADEGNSDGRDDSAVTHL